MWGDVSAVPSFCFTPKIVDYMNKKFGNKKLGEINEGINIGILELNVLLNKRRCLYEYE